MVCPLRGVVCPGRHLVASLHVANPNPNPNPDLVGSLYIERYLPYISPYLPYISPTSPNTWSPLCASSSRGGTMLTWLGSGLGLGLGLG